MAGVPILEEEVETYQIKDIPRSERVEPENLGSPFQSLAWTLSLGAFSSSTQSADGCGLVLLGHSLTLFVSV